MIFIGGEIIRDEAPAIAPPHDGVAACCDDPLDAETKGGMMDIKSPDDVGLVGDAGSSDVGIVNHREVNDGFDIGHGFYDLAKVLNIANKVFDGASFRTGQAVEHSDLMCSAV